MYKKVFLIPGGKAAVRGVPVGRRLNGARPERGGSAAESDTRFSRIAIEAKWESRARTESGGQDPGHVCYTDVELFNGQGAIAAMRSSSGVERRRLVEQHVGASSPSSPRSGSCPCRAECERLWSGRTRDDIGPRSDYGRRWPERRMRRWREGTKV